MRRNGGTIPPRSCPLLSGTADLLKGRAVLGDNESGEVHPCSAFRLMFEGFEELVSVEAEGYSRPPVDGILPILVVSASFAAMAGPFVEKELYGV